MKRMNLAAAMGIVLLLAGPRTGSATTPDAALSFYVPESGSVLTPTQGTAAARFFRGCPNNDGSSYPSSARIRIVLLATGGAPMSGVAAADIYIKLNGGTAAQSFSGNGADSIIANPTYNPSFNCPLVQYLFADAPTNSSGETFITFAGANPGNPGVAQRDPNRKWGHYDSELPVYALGVKLTGRLTPSGGDYVLRIKSFDFRGGLGTALDQGELVSSVDYNSMQNAFILPPDALFYWRDFDGNGVYGAADLNIFTAHMFHTCNTPNNP